MRKTLLGTALTCTAILAVSVPATAVPAAAEPGHRVYGSISFLETETMWTMGDDPAYVSHLSGLGKVSVALQGGMCQYFRYGYLILDGDLDAS